MAKGFYSGRQILGGLEAGRGEHGLALLGEHVVEEAWAVVLFGAFFSRAIG